MKSRSKNWCLIVFFILMFGNVAVGHATAILSVSRSGNGQFIVQGKGLEGVAGMEVVIQYDKKALANPTVEQGGLISGSLMVTNTKEAGKVRIATIDAYPQTHSGTGTIATISFDNAGTAPGSMTINATLVDVKGASLPAQAFVSPFGDAADSSPLPADSTAPTTTAPTTTAPTTTTATSGAVGGYPVLLGVTMPSEETRVEAKIMDDVSASISEPDKSKAKTAEAAERENPPSTSEAVQQALPGKGVIQNKSVLDKLRAFHGEKTPKNLMALFDRATAGIVQNPMVVLSDGKSLVEILIHVPAAGKLAPNIAVEGAKLISFKKTGEATWVAEVLPNKGTFEATVSVLQDDKTVTLPLTVAPPLPAGIKIGEGGKLTATDFNLFLKERGTDKAPSFDLNGDRKRDYIDDYIFTANYLVRLNAGNKPVEKQAQK